MTSSVASCSRAWSAAQASACLLLSDPSTPTTTRSHFFIWSPPRCCCVQAGCTRRPVTRSSAPGLSARSRRGPGDTVAGLLQFRGSGVDRRGPWRHRHHGAGSVTEAVVADGAEYEPRDAAVLAGAEDQKRGAGGVVDDLRAGVACAEVEGPVRFGMAAVEKLLYLLPVATEERIIGAVPRWRGPPAFDALGVHGYYMHRS